MKGKELIDYIQSNHLEECDIKVFSSEKWQWVDVLKPMHRGGVNNPINLDAAYLTNEHVKELTNN